MQRGGVCWQLQTLTEHPNLATLCTVGCQLFTFMTARLMGTRSSQRCPESWECFLLHSASPRRHQNTDSECEFYWMCITFRLRQSQKSSASHYKLKTICVVVHSVTVLDERSSIDLCLALTFDTSKVTKIQLSSKNNQSYQPINQANVDNLGPLSVFLISDSVTFLHKLGT